MGFSRSILSFDDVKETFDKAIATPKGIRIKCVSRSAAVFLRQRFNSYRKMDRMENAKIYEEGHQMFRRSVYDRVVLTIPKKGEEDDNYLYLKKRSAEDFEIEELVGTQQPYDSAGNTPDVADRVLDIDLDVGGESLPRGDDRTPGDSK